MALDLVGGQYLTAEIRAAALAWSHRADRDPRRHADRGRRRRDHGEAAASRGHDPAAARAPRRRPSATDGFVSDVVPCLADGSIRPVVARTFPLADGQEAYETLAAGEVFGKIVLAC